MPPPHHHPQGYRQSVHTYSPLPLDQRQLSRQSHPAEAARVRRWTGVRLAYDDAPTIANELFIAILGSSPARRTDAIEIIISTAGRRARITASGAYRLPVVQTHGPGALIINRLSQSSGVTANGYGLWAQFHQELT